MEQAGIKHEKTYACLVPFIEAKELNIEMFEASSGSSKKDVFVTAHAVMNDKTHELLALISQKDTESEEREVQMRKRNTRNPHRHLKHQRAEEEPTQHETKAKGRQS